jgi:hypothetical protein
MPSPHSVKTYESDVRETRTCVNTTHKKNGSHYRPGKLQVISKSIVPSRYTLMLASPQKRMSMGLTARPRSDRSETAGCSTCLGVDKAHTPKTLIDSSSRGTHIAPKELRRVTDL